MDGVTKIYVIENCYGDPSLFYVGKTKNSRKNDHKKKFGPNIIYTVIDEIDSLSFEYWEPLETYWIEQFRQWGLKLANKRMKGGSGPEFQTEETRIKMRVPKPNSGGKGSKKPGVSQALHGVPRPDTRNRFKGKKMTEQERENLKKGHLNKDKSFYNSDSWLNGIKKPVLQYDKEMNLIKEWPCIKEATESLNLYPSGISQCICGASKTCGGFIWRLKE